MDNSSQTLIFTRVKKTRRLISLTPLIDVVFILLVFFMLASNYEKWHSLPLNSAQKGHGNSNQQTILVRLKEQSLDVNGKEMSRQQLELFIQKRLQQMPNLHVLLQPRGPIIIQRLVDVIDQVKASGVNQVSILHH